MKQPSSMCLELSGSQSFATVVLEILTVLINKHNALLGFELNHPPPLYRA
jgi:hypothetical protein